MRKLDKYFSQKPRPRLSTDTLPSVFNGKYLNHLTSDCKVSSDK